ncbi:MAG: hypothetical protein QT02_C0002G0051 [archaeon GW2011_AR9]|nr:MAG: hypothetical protein QT02_C0002G0051 [archaeon GW2011_AR9]MBS3120594.1 DUF357 domain-containing protein [Candidatus Woesearchaeota archaeon]HIG93648.1 DUF357 domain-containing protein [Candidatus Woesearchaeota archaeon]HIH12496.1 DUF357 domain-containing protein [Candidatus Woesearchaeota archaeon]
MRVQQTITIQKLNQYFSITKEALEKVKIALDEKRLEQARDFLDMAQRYYDDAHYFMDKKENYVLAFAALNYAHGWLDAGARIGLFKVKDNRLFTVDN